MLRSLRDAGPLGSSTQQSSRRGVPSLRPSGPGHACLQTWTPSFSFSPLLPPTCSASLVAQTVKNLPAMRETWVCSLVRKISWRRERQLTPICMPGEFHGQRSLVWATVHGVAKSRTRQQLTLRSTVSALTADVKALARTRRSPAQRESQGLSWCLGHAAPCVCSPPVLPGSCRRRSLASQADVSSSGQTVYKTGRKEGTAGGQGAAGIRDRGLHRGHHLPAHEHHF